MNNTHSKEDIGYKVIINKEGQFAIWQTDIEMSPGWTDTGVAGSKKKCIEYIKENWVDLRPVSLRRKMDK